MMTYILLKSKLFLRSPLIVAVLALSLIVGILGGFVVQSYHSGQTSYAIGIVDLDGTQASEDLIEALSGHPSLSVTRLENRGAVTKALSDKEILQSYVILEGFEEAVDAGEYGHIIEVVSMIKSAYSPWLNDQVSVGVIREWIISDGFKRMQEVNPTYSRHLFEEAFNTYDKSHELLSFQVIDVEADETKDVETGLSLVEQGILWSWCGVLLLLSLVMMRLFYLENTKDIRWRLNLSGIGFGTYHGLYLFLILIVTLLAGSLFLFGLKTSGTVIFSTYNLLIASLFLSVSFFFVVLVLSRLTFNLNQLVLIYLGLFMCWGLFSIEAVGFLPFGHQLRLLSPLTLFFKICA